MFMIFHVEMDCKFEKTMGINHLMVFVVTSTIMVIIMLNYHGY